MEMIEIGGVQCAQSLKPNAEYLLIQPFDTEDFTELDSELTLLAGKTPFSFVAFAVSDWNRDLSPWAAPPVFGKEPFGGGGEATRIWLESVLLPGFPGLRVILGGYSLAGLFSLWCASQSNAFEGIAAASPSVWFPGWSQYAEKACFKVRRVYLSLGDREDRSKNPLLRTVRDEIVRLDSIFDRQGLVHLLEWNPGTHFVDPAGRTARAFRWAMDPAPFI